MVVRSVAVGSGSWGRVVLIVEPSRNGRRLMRFVWIGVVALVLVGPGPVWAQDDAGPDAGRLSLVAHVGSDLSEIVVAGGQAEWRVTSFAAVVVDGMVFDRVRSCALPTPAAGAPLGCDNAGWILGAGVRLPFVAEAHGFEPYAAVLAGYVGGTSVSGGGWQRFALGLDLGPRSVLGFRIEIRFEAVLPGWSAFGLGLGLRLSP